MARVSVPPNGNCLFLSVAHAVMNNIIPNVSVSHLDSLGLMAYIDRNEMSGKLREPIVHECISTYNSPVFVRV